MNIVFHDQKYSVSSISSSKAPRRLYLADSLREISGRLILPTWLILMFPIPTNIALCRRSPAYRIYPSSQHFNFNQIHLPHSHSKFPILSTKHNSYSKPHSPHLNHHKMSSPLTPIPARHGVATPLHTGQTIKIINTHGTQVVDTWAFTLPSFPPTQSVSFNPLQILTQMSMQHTRASLNRTIPRVGDGLYDNERRKMLTVVEDTTEGVHDTLIAACDAARYRELGGEEGHRNCANNLVEGLRALGL